ncbi:MAG: hypothetical protein NC084_09385 [Bacteroides sp.]|nr:hypothetical protein [Eubacterium sp.]MCM1418862.1 hypothetical protein [Roseburia sp.]MCM1462909.1 hypothetical protein [Bacteroides sp.]
MKKIILVVLICIMTFTSIPSTAYANEMGEDGIFGVVLNADGEVVRVIPMPVGRSIYVDTGVTIEAGGSFVSYQYEPTDEFSAGFRFWGRYDDTPTTPDRRVVVSICNASSIGGTKYSVVSKAYSTNYADNVGQVDFDSAIILGAPGISATCPYYNAEFKNLSSSSVYLNIVVSMN